MVEEGCVIDEQGRMVVEEGGVPRENEIMMKRTAAKKGVCTRKMQRTSTLCKACDRYLS